jgi:hypothetical protein
MATLTGNTIASTYTGLLSVTGAVGADTVEAVTDGAGTSTSLSLSQQRATITLGSGAADDFIVDGTTLVVEGDNNRVGIGTASPGATLHTAHSSSTAYNGGAEILESAIIQNTNGSDGSGVNNVASLGLQVGSGATSQGFINYVRTGDNTGDFTFSQRTGSSSYAEHMRITSDGKTGIGTASPDAKLEVTDGVGQVSTGMILSNQRQGNNNNFLRFQKSNHDGSNETIASSGDYLGQIDFQGADANNEYHTGLAMYAVTEGTVQSDQMPTGLHIYTCNTSGATAERMRITADGSVGINETNPAGKMHIALDDGTMPSVVASESALVLQNNSATGDGCTMSIISGTANNSQICFGDAGDYDAGVILYNNSADAMTFRTGGSGEDMRITSGGKVGIGNTSPAHTLTVEDNTNAYTVSFKNNRNPSSSAPYVAMFRFHETPDNGTSEFLRCDDSVGSSAVARLVISSEGDVTNHDNSYGSISDKRIKQDIKDANSQWNDIKAVKVRNFKKNDDVAQYGDKAWQQIGVIAQELEEAGMDKLVKEHPATDNEIDVNDDINKGDMVKTVSYSVLYMKSIKALQEAMAKIETLEAKVEALENA